MLRSRAFFVILSLQLPFLQKFFSGRSEMPPRFRLLPVQKRYDRHEEIQYTGILSFARYFAKAQVKYLGIKAGKLSRFCEAH